MLGHSCIDIFLEFVPFVSCTIIKLPNFLLQPIMGITLALALKMLTNVHAFITNAMEAALTVFSLRCCLQIKRTKIEYPALKPDLRVRRTHLGELGNPNSKLIGAHGPHNPVETNGE